MTETQQLHQLSPLSNAIVDKAIENVNRKLFAGARNKNNSRPNAKTSDIKSTVKDTLEAASAQSAQAVANRGVQWKEMVQLSLTHGVSSLKTMTFDGQFTVKNGVADGLDKMPNTPGVYVVYDKNNEPVYVGDSKNLHKRWQAGHLNENRQKQAAGDKYKLADEFTDGCTVRFVKTDSEITAAALEAHLIKEAQPKVNSREELLTEQGTRSNQEAKKIKDSSESTSSLVKGAASEAVMQSGMVLLEQLSASVLKALKNELVDIFAGGKSGLKVRIKRFIDEVWKTLKSLISQPLKILEGILEFIINALSKTIRQVYMLVRNIVDLVNTAWQLYKGAETMSTEQLITKITETIIISGSAILWDALDPIIELQIAPFLGPAVIVAPFISATICAIGFGISSHYLQGIVPNVVGFLMECRSMHKEAIQAKITACQQLIANAEMNHQLVFELQDYMVGSAELIVEMHKHKEELDRHEKIVRMDVSSLMSGLADKRKKQ